MSAQCHTTMSGNCFQTTETIASFPVPRPASRCLQYGKEGRAWYISSREHDKWQHFQNEDTMVLHVIQHLHVQLLVSMTVAPCYVAGYVWHVTIVGLSTFFLPLTSLMRGNVPGSPCSYVQLKVARRPGNEATETIHTWGELLEHNAL